MPGASDQALGNIKNNLVVYNGAVTFPTLATNASGTSTLTINGVLPLDLIGWNMQAPPAHLILDNAYVSSANTVTLTWSSDATGITGATVAVLFTVDRPTNANLGASALPTAIV
jgi:hypothetical protein